jgi:hypothetical protein
MFLSVVIATPGIDANSNTAITAMATDAAQALRTPRFPNGMGRGEYLLRHRLLLLPQLPLLLASWETIHAWALY